MKEITIQEVNNGWVLTIRISAHVHRVICTNDEVEQRVHTWLTENPSKILSEE